MSFFKYIYTSPIGKVESRSLSLNLSQEGYDVEPCECGLAALKKLEIFEKNNVDLESIILDLRLPDIDGIKLGKIIQSKYPEIKIIFITGYADNYDLEEIRKLKDTKVLEKPVSANELITEFEIIAENKELKKSSAVEQKKEIQKTTSAYALVKLDEQSNFMEVYRKLYFLDNILYCDMTRGDYDIITLIQAQNLIECKEFCKDNIMDLAAVKEVDFLEVGLPIMDENLKNLIQSAERSLSDEENFKSREFSRNICSYIFLEVAREKIEDVYPVLRLSDNVVFCDYTKGKYNLVLFVYGSTFVEIDKFIEDKVSNLRGILKIKEFPVVNIFEM